MTDPSRTNQELLEENYLLHQRINELEQSESERKQVEEALRESEERFRRLANSTWEGIIIHKEGIIVDVNESALKMMTTKHYQLTPKKRQIATLIKVGRSSTEIASILKTSKDTIAFHRRNIRKKLGLANTKDNLQSSLQYML